MSGEEERRIVVGMDESDHSFHALQWALHTLILPSTQPSSNDHIILVHAKTSQTAGLGGPGYIISAELLYTMEKAREREIENFMKKALSLCEENKVKAESKVIPGDPREVICDVVQNVNANYLVIGSHGYGAIKRALLGSVSDYCARHAKCPVVIVRR